MNFPPKLFLSSKGTYTAVAVNDEGQARSNANVAIKTRLKEGVEKSAPAFRYVIQRS